MTPSIDTLSEAGIRSFLPPEIQGHYSITLLDSTTSTNDYMKMLAEKGATKNSVVIANEQTAGKGRRGKAFFSPKDSGIYLSVLLDTADIASLNQGAGAVYNPGSITAYCALATARALQTFTERSVGIKWVNDIYIEDKKVCGILCENLPNTGVQSVQNIVVGIGINVYEPSGEIPEEIIKKVTFVSNSAVKDLRNKIAAQVLRELFDLKSLHLDELHEHYCDMSILNGRDIQIENEHGQFEEVRVIGINKYFALQVQATSGEIKEFISGSILLESNSNI